MSLPQNVEGDVEALRDRVADLEQQLAAANRKVEETRKTAEQTARRPFGYVVELRRDQPWPGIRWRRSRIISSQDEAETCASEWRKQVEGASFLEGSDAYIIPLFAGFPADTAFVANEVVDLLRDAAAETPASMEVLLSRLPEAVTQACENYRKPAKVPSRRSIRLALRRA
ncbi:hypothetical protein OIU34_22980 [Pararhizobium sp. BT-229]|uniref:hypothetical protein n=1 Tax=Pararhizobium sp. BT-229 TaxID=2986923 RepID=UPI0021F7DCFD|nr:hypothetical protein [Pararhizobium sp. BT-229]MCV9964759.1 hypothetical protein [Pararhizobium sp. BT-229]